ncbi:MAG: hypothetical protein WA821_17285 [Anaerolineales bacterium]
MAEIKPPQPQDVAGERLLYDNAMAAYFWLMSNPMRCRLNKRLEIRRINAVLSAGANSDSFFK